MNRRGFTLIEVLISVAIAAFITGAVYFTLDTALDSWSYSRDQLALQKVLSDISQEIESGILTGYGLRDALEIVDAQDRKIEFVPPWTDDTHTVMSGNSVYTLSRKLKPGTAVPIAELKLPEASAYEVVPLNIIDDVESVESKVQLPVLAPPGSQLRFTYHPDPETQPDIIETIWWDAYAKRVFSRYADGIKDLSKNFFGVEISDFKLRYYNNNNELISKFATVDTGDLNMITGIEISMKARLGQYEESIINFINLRNAPMRSGFLTLRKGTRLPIPDSENIHTLYLTNLAGIDNEDVLELEATPVSGKAWRIRVEFSRYGPDDAKIEKVVIEYPPGNEVFMEYPRTSAPAGLNLLMVDSSGRYDYDDDIDIDDLVLLEGEIMLEVKKMDIEGAGLFIRP